MAASDTMAASTPASDSVDAPDATTEEPHTKLHTGFRFWAIMVALSLVSLLTALEGTITSTVLPSVVVGLNGGDNYIWISNAYLLTAAALQPMFGQLANVFGRRWPMIFSAVIFVVGSGICGGATNMGMMIAGRAIQGVGGSGISVLCEIVICDLVPLRERGSYLAFVFGMVAIGSALGPLFGGLLVSYSTSGWRWAFYLSLPVGGLALVLLFAFLHVKYDKSRTLATKLLSLDWLGNAIFIGGTVPILIALSWAGGHYSWSSYQVLVPLIVGLATLGGFIVIESNPRLAPNPMMPTYLFTHSISFIIFLLTFLHGIATFWALFFLPVYFQGVLGETPYRSGIMLLPTILALLPAAMIGGLLLSKFGRYKPLIIISFTLIIVGFGLFSILDEKSSTGAWVGFQVVESIGAGLCIAAFLPALLAPLSDRDTALATATWAFMRSFGITWGVAIAGTVYSNRAAQLAGAGAISDPAVAAGFAAGRAYGYASVEFLDSVPAQTRAEVVSVQSSALQRSWQVAIAFGAVGFIAALALKQIPLRKELETNDFGIVEKKSDSPAEEKGVAGVEIKEVKAPTSTP